MTTRSTLRPSPIRSGSQSRQLAGTSLNGQKVGGQFRSAQLAQGDLVLTSSPAPSVSPTAREDRRQLPARPPSTLRVGQYPMEVDSRLRGNSIALKLVHTRLPGTIVRTGETITYVSPGLRQLRMHQDGTIISPGITETGDIYVHTDWQASPQELNEDMRSALSLAIADDAARGAQVEHFGDEYEMTQVVVEVHPHRATVQLFFDSLNSPNRGSLYYDTSSGNTLVRDPKDRPVRALNTAMMVNDVLSDLARENRNPSKLFSDVVTNFRGDPDFWAAAPSRTATQR